MSDDIFENDEVTVTRFYGGINRGVCFQFTSNGEYVQIPFRETEEMCKATLKYIEQFKKEYPAYKSKVYEQ